MPWEGGEIVPIRWRALKVSEAADRIEEQFNHAVEPLEQARTVAREALKMDNLPEYMSQHFSRIIGEIDRAIGVSQWEPVGRIRAGI
jgi:sugar-specific transcriptional regulator TrmB